MFVEPAEEETYRAALPHANLVSIGRDACGDAGSFARWFALRWAREHGQPVVVADDDLRQLYRVSGNDGTANTFDKLDDGAEVVRSLLADVTDGPYAVSVVGHHWLARYSKFARRPGGIVRQFYALNPERLPEQVKVDLGFHVLHDLDLTIQCLTYGVPFCTRFDYAAVLDFKGYEEKTEEEIVRLRRKWGRQAVSVQRHRDGRLKSVGPATPKGRRPGGKAAA